MGLTRRHSLQAASNRGRRGHPASSGRLSALPILAPWARPASRSPGYIRRVRLREPLRMYEEEDKAAARPCPSPWTSASTTSTRPIPTATARARSGSASILPRVATGSWRWRRTRSQRVYGRRRPPPDRAEPQAAADRSPRRPAHPRPRGPRRPGRHRETRRDLEGPVRGTRPEDHDLAIGITCHAAPLRP